jgi:hypothetical protein
MSGKNILQNVNAYLKLFSIYIRGNLSIAIYMHLIAYSSIFLCFTYCFS